MKSKATVYLLVAAVLVVWGVIAWKLLAPSREETYAVPSSASKAAIIEENDTLTLDYSDPFLKKQSVIPVSERMAPSSEKNGKIPQSTNKIREECRIRYIGYICLGKARSCIVESGGAHYSVAKGESVDGFRLVKIFPDSLVFTKDGFSYPVVLSR